MAKSDMGVAKRGASPDTTAQRPSASSGALPRVEYFDGSGALCVSDGEGAGAALVYAEGATHAEMQAIVRAVNHHDKLVSALREVTESADAVAFAENIGSLDEVIAAARAVLAEVEGR